MDANSIYTVIITALTILGSTEAWKYFEKRAILKQKKENESKDECNQRITKLEILLANSSKEKDTLRNQILQLTEQLSTYRVKVEFLEREIMELKSNK